MSDRDALFAAILANPDEDTPRLMFADWLEENGDPRYAAFIRKQIELAKVPEWDSLWVGAWQSDRDIITGNNYATFEPELAPGLTWPSLTRYRRGFPWHVGTIEAEPFIAHAEELYRAMPLQSLTVKADSARWREAVGLTAFFASPHLAPLKQLRFSLTRFTPDTARQLGDCPRLPHLRSLEFEFATLDAGAAQELLRSPLITRLESLEFDKTIVGAGELGVAITEAGGPYSLRRFRFIPFNTGQFGNAGVFNSPLLSGLRELEISNGGMQANCFAALCQSSAVRNLEALTLNKVEPGVPGIKVLAGCEWLRGLKCLRLGGNRLGPVAMKALARSPHLQNLQVLDLSGNKLGDGGAVELARAPWLKNLAGLDLMHCGVLDAGVEALADALDPDKVVRLELFSGSYRVKQTERVRQKLRDKFGDRASA